MPRFLVIRGKGVGGEGWEFPIQSHFCKGLLRSGREVGRVATKILVVSVQ